MKIQIIQTSEGWCAALWEKGKLAGITLPHLGKEEAVTTLAGYVKMNLSQTLVESKPTDQHQKQLASDMDSYFSGKHVEYNIDLDWERVTDFQRRVLEVVAQIPYGSSLSYGEIAKIIDNPRAARAVGGAVGSNPWLVVVPCHRVLACNRVLGGFSSGLAWKERLLKIENIT